MDDGIQRRLAKPVSQTDSGERGGQREEHGAGEAR